jgi:hypothetical protein
LDLLWIYIIVTAPHGMIAMLSRDILRRKPQTAQRSLSTLSAGW